MASKDQALRKKMKNAKTIVPSAQLHPRALEVLVEEADMTAAKPAVTIDIRRAKQRIDALRQSLYETKRLSK